MTCKNPSPLISEAEFCYAAAYALKQMKKEELLKEAAQLQSIHQLQELIFPVLAEEKKAYEEQPQMKRLIELLISSRVEGELNAQIRTLLQ